jgi:WD40 repeat protein
VLRKFDYESGRELAPPFKALIGMGLLSGLRSPSWLSEGRVLDWSNPSNVVVWTDYYGPPSGMKLVRPKATQDSSPPKDIPLVDLSVVRNGISSSCSTLAAITSATEVSVWQFDGKQPAVRLLPHSESVKSVHVSDDGNSILTTSAVGVNLIGYKKWNSHTGELLSSGNFRDPTFMISFSPDLSTFVGESGAPTNCARIYDASSLTPLAKLERNDQRLISKALFCSQTNLVLATAIMPDYFALLYKVDVGTHRVQLLREIQLPQFDPGYATYTVASPRGTYVAVYSPLHPTRLFIINFERESQQSEPVRLKNPVQSIQFSSDETLLFVSERGNNSFRIWDVETGLPLTRYFRCEKPVVGGAFYDDDSKVAVLLSDGSVQTWSLWPKNTNPPDWLPSLAEAVAGLSLNFNGVLETKVDAATEIVRIREQLAQETGDNDWNSWGRWFLDIDQQRRNSTAQAALNFDSFPFPEDPQSYEAAPER